MGEGGGRMSVNKGATSITKEVTSSSTDAISTKGAMSTNEGAASSTKEIMSTTEEVMTKTRTAWCIMGLRVVRGISSSQELMCHCPEGTEASDGCVDTHVVRRILSWKDGGIKMVCSEKWV